MISQITRKGFTLIELLVVIAIIGLLSSVVLASLSSARAKARDNTRIQNLVQLRTALELYASSNNGNYPSTGSIHNVYMDPGCTQTHSSGSGDVTGTQANWIPGLVPNYISILPKDPTSKSSVDFGDYNGCYMYSSDGTGYILSAYGTIEGSSNGGTMDSNFGYREMWVNRNNEDQLCYYSTNYQWIDAVKRKSFTITNLTLSDIHGCGTI